MCVLLLPRRLLLSFFFRVCAVCLRLCVYTVEGIVARFQATAATAAPKWFSELGERVRGRTGFSGVQVGSCWNVDIHSALLRTILLFMTSTVYRRVVSSFMNER